MSVGVWVRRQFGPGDAWPTESRDEGGRFDGGEGKSSDSKGTSQAEKLRQKDGSPPNPKASAAELRIEAVVGPNGGADLGNMNPDQMDAVASTVERYGEDYPGKADGLFVNVGPLNESGSGQQPFAQAFGGMQLTYSDEWFGKDASPTDTNKALSLGAHEDPNGPGTFHPPSTGTVEGVTWHELGHVYDANTGTGAASRASVEKMWGDANSMQAVSGYASSGGSKEAFAEAFAAYNTGGRLPAPVVDALGRAGVK